MSIRPNICSRNKKIWFKGRTFGPLEENDLGNVGVTTSGQLFPITTLRVLLSFLTQVKPLWLEIILHKDCIPIRKCTE